MSMPKKSRDTDNKEGFVPPQPLAKEMKHKKFKRNQQSLREEGGSSRQKIGEESRNGKNGRGEKPEKVSL